MFQTVVQNVPSSSLDENSLFYNDSGDESLNKYSLVCMTSEFSIFIVYMSCFFVLFGLF